MHCSPRPAVTTALPSAPMLCKCTYSLHLEGVLCPRALVMIPDLLTCLKCLSNMWGDTLWKGKYSTPNQNSSPVFIIGNCLNQVLTMKSTKWFSLHVYQLFSAFYKLTLSLFFFLFFFFYFLCYWKGPWFSEAVYVFQLDLGPRAH